MVGFPPRADKLLPHFRGRGGGKSLTQLYYLSPLFRNGTGVGMGGIEKGEDITCPHLEQIDEPLDVKHVRLAIDHVP